MLIWRTDGTIIRNRRSALENLRILLCQLPENVEAIRSFLQGIPDSPREKSNANAETKELAIATLNELILIGGKESCSKTANEGNIFHHIEPSVALDRLIRDGRSKKLIQRCHAVLTALPSLRN